MEKILVAVDGSEGSKKALARCAEIAKCMDCEVIVLWVQRSLLELERSNPQVEALKRVMEEQNIKKEIETSVRGFLNSSKKFLLDNSVREVKTLLLWGHPVEEILKVADEEKVDLIVLGSRGRRIGKAFLGSVSREVSDRAKASVMIGR
jgi:nucleotide-binding universal stress UspA family protein